MKKFEIFKTIQLILFIALTALSLSTVFRDDALYQTIASDPHVKLLSFVLWAVLGLSFLFLFLDFGSYTDLKRENIELDQAVYADALTGVANRYSCDAYIGRYLHVPLPADMACVTLDLVNLKEINEKAGHEGGDAAIHAFSDILMEAGREKGVSGTAPGERSGKKGKNSTGSSDCFIGRNGGNKFLVIFRNCSEKKLETFRESVSRRCAQREAEGEIPLEYTYGEALAHSEDVDSLTALVALSDRRAEVKPG